MPPKQKKAAQSAQASQDDAPMTDAPPVAPEHLLPSLEEQRIRILPGSSETAASFEFLNEDHTLGNALRYIIMKNPHVEFCGYSIPHPSEAKMNVRVQTFEGTTAFEALEKGLDDLMDLCDVVTDEFERARTEFERARTDFAEQGMEQEMVD